jgi:hypothetical protein
MKVIKDTFHQTFVELASHPISMDLGTFILNKLLEQPYVSVAFIPIIKGDYYDKLGNRDLSKVIKRIK